MSIFRRRVITVRASHVKNGEPHSVPMNQLLTDTLKSVKLADNQGDRVFCNREGMSHRQPRDRSQVIEKANAPVAQPG